ncbi:hypothetical protein FGW37_25330 [Streptomyces rectiverticillatus]|uniref:hypothetical protein n=1 Tax=Streptomyces rectiverticillatus TaxID=173860 RepID=UPI0015C36B36|nr:hypothetical protein [Streptomyces rectiverticillatus]QLE74473.1 hypothetical protein FGW37_25330 [Streptomyces rectiverticillatus]
MMNARANAHPYDEEGTRADTSCLTCAVLVMKRAAALRQGPAAVEEVERRRKEHLRQGCR